VFEILPGARVSLIELRIRHGQTSLAGCIISTTTVLTLTKSIVISNAANASGGLLPPGQLRATETDYRAQSSRHYRILVPQSNKLAYILLHCADLHVELFAWRALHSPFFERLKLN